MASTSASSADGGGVSVSIAATTGAAPAPHAEPIPARFSALVAAHGEATFRAIQSARVLVVGAGGIGCELLKNLVLSGFVSVTVLDLDTIDVSNLNRQFLFRRAHVGQSKALIAKASVGAFQPTADIKAIHGNIKDQEYDHDWFGQFTLVLNALDNLEARRHVNRLCLSAGRTLLESGTQGYAGQSSVIRGGTTECFECVPAATPKTFAVCTIRNTPDKPVHTVVWAKALYAALFGPPDEGGIMSDACMDLQEGVTEAQAKAAAFASGAADPYSVSSYSTLASTVFRKLFTIEIEKQREVTERWKERPPPEALNLEALLESLRPAAPVIISKSFRSRDHAVLTTAENAAFLLHTLDATLSTRSAELGDLAFDKDDELSMDFVSCASNLRMANFGIGVQSRFAVKGVAGNIVHAIATTNAIAAGLMVADAIKILQGRIDLCRTMWINRRAPGLLTAQMLAKPDPKCFVCAQSTQELTLDTNTWTLKRLYEEVLGKKLSMNEPGIDVLNRDNFIGTQDDHSEDNPEYLLLPLSSSGVRLDNGALLSVEDQSQKLSVRLRIKHQAEWPEEDPDQYTLTGEVPTTQPTEGGEEEKKDQTAATPATAACAIPAAAAPAAADDDIEMSDTPIVAAAPSSAPASAASAAAATGVKRKAEDEPEHNGGDAKRPKPAATAATEDDGDVIELD